jgi:hypothetical protein
MRKSQDQIKKEWNQRIMAMGASERYLSLRVQTPSIGEHKARYDLKRSARTQKTNDPAISYRAKNPGILPREVASGLDDSAHDT